MKREIHLNLRRMMKSALYSNIVWYPIRRHGEYIAHYTPGKKMGQSGVHWDSGFIGLGMLDYSSKPCRICNGHTLLIRNQIGADFAFGGILGSLGPQHSFICITRY